MSIVRERDQFVSMAIRVNSIVHTTVGQNWDNMLLNGNKIKISVGRLLAALD